MTYFYKMKEVFRETIVILRKKINHINILQNHSLRNRRIIINFAEK